jgi:hypothetical protein
MMDFRSIIPRTFGIADFKFAFHSSEAEQAIELLKICYENNVSLKELLSAVEDFLRKSGARNDHVKEQLKEVKAKFSGWLE